MYIYLRALKNENSAYLQWEEVRVPGLVVETVSGPWSGAGHHCDHTAARVHAKPAQEEKNYVHVKSQN